MSENASQKDEEIDLGQLFTLVGRMFSKISAFLVLIWGLLSNSVLRFLIFIKKHFIKFVIMCVVGLITGWLIDKTKKPEFEASLVVKPNYQSGRQLYKNIAYYDELIRQKNFLLLSETFGITKEDAQALVSFEIEPVINENHMLSTYDEFLSSIDSTVALNFKYEAYTENFKDYAFNQHEIIVTSTANNIFSKLESVIVSGVKGNPFFQKLEESERQILERNEMYLASSLLELDTLRKVYTDVLIKESEKEVSQGTSINMASGKESTKELDLFKEENKINKNIDKLNRTQVRSIEILNVVSSFQKIGFRKNNLEDLWAIRIPVFLCLLLFLGLLIVKIDQVIPDAKK